MGMMKKSGGEEYEEKERLEKAETAKKKAGAANVE